VTASFAGKRELQIRHIEPVALTITAAASQQSDVSSQVKVTTSGLVYSRATGAYTGTVTIANIVRHQSLPHPVGVTSLIPGATLSNATGTTPSGPYAGARYVTLQAVPRWRRAVGEFSGEIHLYWHRPDFIYIQNTFGGF